MVSLVREIIMLTYHFAYWKHENPKALREEVFSLIVNLYLWFKNFLLVSNNYSYSIIQGIKLPTSALLLFLTSTILYF